MTVMLLKSCCLSWNLVQENVLAESRMMIPDCHKRLEAALTDLKGTLVFSDSVHCVGAYIIVCSIYVNLEGQITFDWSLFSLSMWCIGICYVGITKTALTYMGD